MIILQALKWAAIVIGSIAGALAAVILAVIAVYLLCALGEHLLYTRSQHRLKGHRNWAVNRGALDEDVMPSAEERRQAQLAAVALQPEVTVLKPAASKADGTAGLYDKTGKVLPFKRPAKIDVRV
jgi:hypothetical protein